MTDEGPTMSLIEHLEELRRRLIVVVISIVLAAVVGFFFSGAVLDLLRVPLPAEYGTIYFTGPADAFGSSSRSPASSASRWPCR